MILINAKFAKDMSDISTPETFNARVQHTLAKFNSLVEKAMMEGNHCIYLDIKEPIRPTTAFNRYKNKVISEIEMANYTVSEVTLSTRTYLKIEW